MANRCSPNSEHLSTDGFSAFSCISGSLERVIIPQLPVAPARDHVRAARIVIRHIPHSPAINFNRHFSSSSLSFHTYCTKISPVCQAPIFACQGQGRTRARPDGPLLLWRPGRAQASPARTFSLVSSAPSSLT